MPSERLPILGSRQVRNDCALSRRPDAFKFLNDPDGFHGRSDGIRSSPVSLTTPLSGASHARNSVLARTMSPVAQASHFSDRSRD